jgi:hypothetical protein
MRRFYPDTDAAGRHSQTLLTALIGAAALLIYGLDRSGLMTGTVWLITAAGLTPVVYGYVKARYLETAPLIEVTDTTVRWRASQSLLASSVALANLVRVHHDADDGVYLITSDGLARRLTVEPAQLSGGRFALEMALHEIERAIPETEMEVPPEPLPPIELGLMPDV